MKELIAKIETILEEENIDISKRFTDFDMFDSLAILSIMAMLDADYRISMNGKQLRAFDSIEQFCKAVLDNYNRK
jgi:acyl carrier protein